jgi:hypothetical protein
MKPEVEQVAWNVAAGAGGGMVRHLARFLANPKQRWAGFLAGTITGTICAVFMTPIAAHSLGWATEPEKTTGLAFFLGCLGMEGVELMLRKVRKTLGSEERDIK